MPDFPYRLRGAPAVRAVVATVTSDPEFVAGCLVVGGAHGYSMEMEYMRRTDGTTRYRVWSDVQGIISTDESRTNVDFAGVLARVREAKLSDTSLPGAGRRTLVVLATVDGGAWVEAPTPGTTDAPSPVPLAPIFELVFT